MIKLIVGLSNPGSKYIFTRHNAGSWYVNLLAKYYKKQFTLDNRFNGYVSNILFNNTCIYLLIPTLYMNNSGISVYKMINFYKIKPKEILVAHDELDLLPGDIRFKFCSSRFNSHKGITSINNYLDNNQYINKLRIGIGRPKNRENIINYVISKPSTNEQKLIDKAIITAVKCTYMIFNENYEQAISYLNLFKFKN